MCVDLSHKRIVSLTKETREWLCLLVEEARIVGISNHMLRLRWAREEKPKVSAFLNPKIGKILTLLPQSLFEFFDVSADSVDISQGESRNIVDAPSLIKCWDEILEPISYREAQYA